MATNKQPTTHRDCFRVRGRLWIAHTLSLLGFAEKGGYDVDIISQAREEGKKEASDQGARRKQKGVSTRIYWPPLARASSLLRSEPRGIEHLYGHGAAPLDDEIGDDARAHGTETHALAIVTRDHVHPSPARYRPDERQ